ncbi:cbb3-type cytochrome c oxidase N-terminal domain-containing protein [uncultured Draconibacterium sp.]|uniref:cbb3-type cytochrome c oxidase N-terminal domain-containing protein n=1 Tax=uncultured Draconibacterium sp. TaxID=1573823 RepID=UPI003260AAFB
MSDKNKQILDQDEHLMDHDYDGIKELDNPPPRWIMLMFYITIGWSILYGAYYFWLKEGDHQDAEYAKKSMKHDDKYQIASLSADELTAFTDEASIAEGKQIYTDMACMACHGMNGEGNAIGPNLCDEYSLNGCDFESVFNIIKNGNPAKGMTAFKGQISDEKIQKVASYVLTMQGTNPPNAKEAQGEKCE